MEARRNKTKQVHPDNRAKCFQNPPRIGKPPRRSQEGFKTARRLSRNLSKTIEHIPETNRNVLKVHPTSPKTRPTRQISLSKFRQERNGNGKICLFCRFCSLEKDIELQETELTHERANKTLDERLMPLPNRTCSRDVIGGIGTSFQVPVKSRVVLSTLHRLQKQNPS